MESGGARSAPRVSTQMSLPHCLTPVGLPCAEYQDLIDRRAALASNRHDTETFFRELKAAGQSTNNKKSKFDVIAEYCKKDLFAGINDPQEEETKSSRK